MKRNRLKLERVENLVSIHTNLRFLSRKSKSYNKGESKMWGIGGYEWDPFEAADILEIAIFSLDEPNLELVIFTDEDEMMRLTLQSVIFIFMLRFYDVDC